MPSPISPTNGQTTTPITDPLGVGNVTIQVQNAPIQETAKKLTTLVEGRTGGIKEQINPDSYLFTNSTINAQTASLLTAF